jgi:hypothetical protein
MVVLYGCAQKTQSSSAASQPAGVQKGAPGAVDAKDASMDEHAKPSDPALSKPGEKGPADAKVFIRAFYPGNEKHKVIRDYVLAIPDKYPGKVRARFVPFDTDEGFKEWQQAGLTCGSVLIDDKQTFTVKKKDGKSEEVTFKMFWGGEWTQEDLDAAVADEVAARYPK